jgi:hypothetical protein
LDELTELNIFDNITVQFDGIEPNAYVTIDKSELDSLGLSTSGLDIKATPDSKVKNGDKVTVAVSKETQDYLLNNGYQLTETTREYAVEGLDAYLMSLDELQSEASEKMEQNGKDVLNAEIASFTCSRRVSDKEKIPSRTPSLVRQTRVSPRFFRDFIKVSAASGTRIPSFANAATEQTKISSPLMSQEIPIPFFAEMLRAVGKAIPCAEETSARAIGCWERNSAAAQRRSISLSERFPAEKVASIFSSARVSVPVLSKTAVLISASFSKADPLLTRIPSPAALPIPAAMAVGVAKANAQGQKTTRMVTPRINAVIKLVSKTI